MWVRSRWGGRGFAPISSAGLGHDTGGRVNNHRMTGHGHGPIDLPLSGEGAVARSRSRARGSRPGQTLPADRLYAIENGPSGFDPAAPGYLPKSRFLMLMRNERLARAAHALRRREPHPDDRARRPRGRARRPAHAGGPRRDRGLLRRLLRRRAARPAEGAAAPRPQLLGCGRARWCRSSISPRSPRVEAAVGVAGPSAALSRQRLRRRGWPAWHEFDLLGRRSRSATRAAEGRQADRALRRHQCRSATPASAIWQSRTR